MPSTINNRVLRDEMYIKIHLLAQMGVEPSSYWDAEVRSYDLNCGIYNDKSTWERYQSWKKEKGI